MNVEVISLSGEILMVIRVKVKERRERDRQDLSHMKEYKAGDLIFINIEDIK